jgi:hypothetical protein
MDCFVASLLAMTTVGRGPASLRGAAEAIHGEGRGGMDCFLASLSQVARTSLGGLAVNFVEC